MSAQAKKKGLIKWQLPMKRVLYALIPVMLASIYFFGWRSLLILILVNIAGFLTEYLFLLPRKEQVSSAVFVTNCLLALALPPTIPYWMAVLGAVIAVLFGKMVFGGFGRNVFNPAMVGRAFLYISFGIRMTSSWAEPFRGFPAGLARFTPDAVSRATPLVGLAEGGYPAWQQLLLGNIPGSFGETSALLLILGGVYLVWKKAASLQIVLGSLAGFFAAQTAFWLAGILKAADPLTAVLAGSFIMGVFFNITDPVSASQTTNLGRWIYGAFFGIIVVLIRTFSVWPEGTMFSILLANMFAPILDYLIKESRKRRAAR